MQEKELLLISRFRENSRTSLTKLSRLTKIPVSTLFDKIKEYEKTNLIRKHTALIDFKMLGYNVKTQILVMAKKENKEELQKFLMRHPKINTVFRINNGYDYLAEAIFKDLEELDEFTRKLEEYEPIEKKEFFVMEDIKREEFLSHKENLGIQR
jgi:Lrp/AsnC family transcriptional regulator, leucine-responsive regulatory protein